MVLSEGYERTSCHLYEEVNIPPSEAAPTEIGKDRVAVSDLDEVCTAPPSPA